MLLCFCIFFLLMHILIGGCNDILHQNKHALPVEWHPKHYKSRLAYYKLLFFAFHHTCYSITMTLLDVTLAHQHIISKADGSYWKWHTFYSNKGTMAHLFAQWKDDKVCYPNLSLELMHSYCPDTSEPQHGCQWSSKMSYPHIWRLGLVDCFEAREKCPTRTSSSMSFPFLSSFHDDCKCLEYIHQSGICGITKYGYIPASSKEYNNMALVVFFVTFTHTSHIHITKRTC